MSKPESRGPGRAPLPAVRVNAFFHHLGRTGSVTVAANRAQLRRSTLYERRQNDEEFAERWARALDLGVERLQGQRPEPRLEPRPEPRPEPRDERHGEAGLSQRHQNPGEREPPCERVLVRFRSQFR